MNQMDYMIVFTPAQLFAGVLAVCGAITVVAAAIGVVATAVQKAKAPNKLQDDRLDAHEEWLKRHDELLTKDKGRLENIEAGERITQKAILALLSHGIDGNDIEGMRKAKAELQEFLIEK